MSRNREKELKKSCKCEQANREVSVCPLGLTVEEKLLVLGDSLLEHILQFTIINYIFTAYCLESESLISQLK